MENPTHWLLRVGDGEHFLSSQRFARWGVCSTHSWVPKFLRSVRKGDMLWFVQSNTGGKVMAVATYTHHCYRVQGPLIALTPTNEDLGWTKKNGDWDTEIHYASLYDLTAIPQPILTRIQGPLTGRVYNSEKCDVDLPAEYTHIVKYLHPQ